MGRLKESKNKLTIHGWLNSKEVKEKTINGKKAIEAKLEIRTQDNNIVPVEMFSFERTTKGEVSKIFEEIKKVEKEYVTAKDVESWDQADKVAINNGEFAVDEYKHKQSGEIVKSYKCSTKFIHRPNDKQKFDPSAKFLVEGIVAGIREEKREGDETGNGFVDLYMINYNGNLIPITLKAYGKIFEGIQKTLNKNDYVSLEGKILNLVEVVEKEEPTLFGSPRKISTRKYINERVIENGTMVESVEIDDDDLEEAVKLRTDILEAKKQGKKLTPKKEDSNDDLPF